MLSVIMASASGRAHSPGGSDLGVLAMTCVKECLILLHEFFRQKARTEMIKTPFNAL